MLLFLLFLSAQAVAKIEDNSFLLEEGFNQEQGYYQFIQKYQTRSSAGPFTYSLEAELPLTDKVHQLSFRIPVERSEGFKDKNLGDVTISYRCQPLNTETLLIADRFGLIVPTGRLEKDTGNGVYGLEFVHAMTLTLSERVMNHWNFGIDVLPNAKTYEHARRGMISKLSAGSSLIYLNSDDFNIMFETLLETEQTVQSSGSKSTSSTLTLNPGIRFSWDIDWKEAQIVPGISFPTEVLSSRTELGVLVYLSIEPKFY